MYGQIRKVLPGALALDLSRLPLLFESPLWTQIRTKTRMGSMAYFTEAMTIFSFHPVKIITTADQMLEELLMIKR